MILQHIIFEKNLHYLESYKQVLISVGVIGDNKIIFLWKLSHISAYVVLR